MDNIIYLIGEIVVYGGSLIIVIGLIQGIIKGFEPTSLVTKDKAGKEFWIPNRIYHAMSLSSPINLEGGQYTDYYENIANKHPQRLIEVTDEHDMDWMRYRHYLYQDNKCRC